MRPVTIRAFEKGRHRPQNRGSSTPRALVSARCCQAQPVIGAAPAESGGHCMWGAGGSRPRWRKPSRAPPRRKTITLDRLILLSGRAVLCATLSNGQGIPCDMAKRPEKTELKAQPAPDRYQRHGALCRNQGHCWPCGIGTRAGERGTAAGCPRRSDRRRPLHLIRGNRQRRWRPAYRRGAYAHCPAAVPATACLRRIRRGSDSGRGDRSGR